MCIEPLGDPPGLCDLIGSWFELVVPTEGRDLRPQDAESALETCEIEGIRLMRL